MCNYIEEINKSPVIAETDVLVCGAGPAGIGASIRAVALSVKQNKSLSDVDERKYKKSFASNKKII